MSNRFPQTITNSDTFRIPDLVKQRTWTTRLRDLAAALLVLW